MRWRLFPILRSARADVDLRALAEKIKAAPSKALSFCLTDKGLRAARDRSPILLPCRIEIRPILAWILSRFHLEFKARGIMSEELDHQVFPTEELRRSKCDRDAFAAKPRFPIMVVLDRVTQGYNIGAIFRLCDAMLVERLVITGAEIHLRKRRLSQSARGTQYWTPWSQESSAEEAVIRAKADGYQIVVVELAANSVRPEAFIGNGEGSADAAELSTTT